MSNDDIIAEKAFIWACGKNSDGQLGLGTTKCDGENNLPKNIV
jgi:hypothetical protein